MEPTRKILTKYRTEMTQNIACPKTIEELISKFEEGAFSDSIQRTYHGYVTLETTGNIHKFSVIIITFEVLKYFSDEINCNIWLMTQNGIKLHFQFKFRVIIITSTFDC